MYQSVVFQQFNIMYSISRIHIIFETDMSHLIFYGKNMICLTYTKIFSDFTVFQKYMLAGASPRTAKSGA